MNDVMRSPSAIRASRHALCAARPWAGAEGSARNEAQPIEARAKRTPKEAF